MRGLLILFIFLFVSAGSYSQKRISNGSFYSAKKFNGGNGKSGTFVRPGVGNGTGPGGGNGGGNGNGNGSGGGGNQIPVPANGGVYLLITASLLYYTRLIKKNLHSE